jgi:hypothetical protein
MRQTFHIAFSFIHNESIPTTTTFLVPHDTDTFYGAEPLKFPP